MFLWVYVVVIMASCWFFAYGGSYVVRELMRTITPLRAPTDRDNHTMPTPHGGGIAVMLAIIGFMVVTGADTYLVLGLLLLFVVSAWDDMSELSPLTRVIVHVFAATLTVSTIGGGQLHGIVSPLVEYIVSVLALVWFMNISNFMDGIDELAAMHTASIAGAIVVLGIMLPELPRYMTIDALIILSAICGFWRFNRHPASLFLGDSGSIPLGALLGWLLLTLSAQGQWVAAAILPAYYIKDGGMTMVMRALKGETLWHAHSSHAYQVAVRRGYSHSEVAYGIAGLHIVLAALAMASIAAPAFALYYLIAAYVLAGAMCLHLRNLPRRDMAQEDDVIEGKAEDVTLQETTSIGSIHALP